eukprot:scaffold661134_cov59-Attheya_sp.AAC.3
MEPMLHARHVGVVANHLHLAAATNHIGLVQRNNGYRELPLPQDWADVRGHTEVAELLRQSRKGRRPTPLSERASNIQTGCLMTFFPRADRQYGFINGKVFSTNQGFPRPGQKLHFVTATNRCGREKAIHVVDGADKSYLRLSILESQDAERACVAI